MPRRTGAESQALGNRARRAQTGEGARAAAEGHRVQLAERQVRAREQVEREG